MYLKYFFFSIVMLSSITVHAFIPSPTPPISSGYELPVVADKFRFDQQLIRSASFHHFGTARSEFEITISDSGQLIFQNKPLSTGLQEFDWIMDKDKRMYGFFKQSGNFFGEGAGSYHSSLLGDEWPICAGAIKTDSNGKIISISNKSGHFAPEADNLKYAFNILMEKKADISPLVNLEKQSVLKVHESNSLNILDRVPYSVAEYKKLLAQSTDETVRLKPLTQLTPLSPTQDGVLHEAQAQLDATFYQEPQNLNEQKLQADYLGNLVHSSFTESDSEYTLAWVAKSNSDFFAVPMENRTTNYHASLLNDEWPVAAGTMKVKNGTIMQITNQSEFFKPSKESLEKVVWFLKQRFVPMHPDAEQAIRYAPVTRLNSDISVDMYRENLENGRYFQSSSQQIMECD